MVDTATAIAVSKYNHTLVDTKSTGHKEVNPYEQRVSPLALRSDS